MRMHGCRKWGGGGGGGGKGGTAPPVSWTGEAQGAPRNGTSTCRSLINIIAGHMTSDQPDASKTVH